MELEADGKLASQSVASGNILQEARLNLTKCMEDSRLFKNGKFIENIAMKKGG